MRAVVGVRVQDELGVGKELLQDVGVDRRDHDVVGAVDDEDGKLKALEVGVAGVLGGAISRDRRTLGDDGLVRDGRGPLEEATPALLNKMTSRLLAKASLRAGSWSSRVPMKCWKNTSGGRPGVPRRRNAKRIPPPSAYWVGAMSCVNQAMMPASPPDGPDGIRNLTALLPCRSSADAVPQLRGSSRPAGPAVSPR
jgi:hypothetical protein